MKITKTQLKQIIKEELEATLDPLDKGLDEGGTYNFEVYYSDHLSGRKQSTAYYLINVPYSELDTKEYEDLKKTAVARGSAPPDASAWAVQFLKIKPELLEKAGYRYGAGTMDYRYVEEIPDTIPVTVQKPPTIVDASTL
jgi:hypothetical protein